MRKMGRKQSTAETIETYDDDDGEEPQETGMFLISKKHKVGLKQSSAQNTDAAGSEARGQMGSSNSSSSGSITISDLPYQLLIDILSRLPVKTVLSCKSVCKPWLALLSTPEFFKIHFQRASTRPLLLSYGLHGGKVPKTMHLIEAEAISDLVDGAGEFAANADAKANLISKLDHPMRNAEIKLIPNYTLPCNLLTVVNSCRGLFCMVTSDCPTLVVVCNPISGDYITVSTSQLTNAFLIGLGFSPSTNQYKLLRIALRQVIEPMDEDCCFCWGTELYTIGSRGAWRRIENVLEFGVFCQVKPSFITSVNEHLFWTYDKYEFIDSFDFDNEKFKRVSPPPGYHGLRSCMSLGVLGGSLCLSNSSSLEICEIWILKHNGTIQESWNRAYAVEIPTAGLQLRDHGWSCFYQPIRYLNNGEVLMFYSRNALVAYDPVKQTVRYLKISGVQAKCEAIPHIPCLVSLKDIMGDNVKLLNAKSRTTQPQLSAVKKMKH